MRDPFEGCDRSLSGSVLVAMVGRSNERISLLKELHNFNKSHSLDLAQKAKVRWAIEGDENSKYFHGIINKKRSQLAIHGVLIDGDWIDEPCKVKNEFLMHFANQFESPSGPCIDIDCHLFKKLSSEQVDDLECDVTFDEIKKAVWDCGTNKSPGPDGFSFDFIRTFWDILKHDFVNAIREFFISSKFPPGCNSSFIALIPKKHDAKFVKDYRPISLIGCFYKIVSKILANRLKMVISELISDVQSAFGIRFDDSLTLSHLFYADDAVFIGNGIEANNLTIFRINLLALLKKKVGNGANTLFWEDCWINDVPLSRSFPRLYALELKKGITVADKLIDASFVASFRRNPRGGVEEEQLH
ncbi:hypothetical protein Tco_1433376, partial [Tanacetum coccineum]